MCGIFGWALGAANRQNGETLARITNLMAHRGPDGAGYSLSRHRRWALPDRLGPSPSFDHRYRRRAAADVERGRPIHRHLQRRDLQLHRAPRGALGARPSLSHDLRHRGSHRGLPRLGPRGDPPVSRHVRLRAVGRGDATARARARCLRQEAAVPRHAPGRASCSAPRSSRSFSSQGSTAPSMSRRSATISSIATFQVLPPSSAR